MQKKMKQNKRNFIITGLLLFASVLFTVLVKTVDVQPVGPQQSRIGFAAINEYMFRLTGEHLFWYHLTDLLGVIAILAALGFAVVGIFQLVRRKSIKKVDKSLLMLGMFYVLTVCIYILFELFIVNYRPVLMDGVLEASFPSSHAMIVYCIMTTAMIQFHLLTKNKRLRILFDISSAIIITVTVIGRFLSGVHWFTDIVGGLLIGSTLIMMYYSFSKLADKE